TRRQLKRLLDRGILDQDTYELMQARLDELYRKPVRHRERPPVVATPIVPVFTPRVEEEPILEALPVEQASAPPPVPTPEVHVRPEGPPPPPKPPRRTLGEVLAAFMEQHNILWGELAGGLLIVGCSVALVVYLWQTQKEIVYFPFFVAAGVTASLFGAGVYTPRRWKRDTTSRAGPINATHPLPLWLHRVA